MDKLIDNIKESEGFVGTVYKDSLGFNTVGYGTKMPLSRYEAELLLRHRLESKIHKLLEAKPFVAKMDEKRQAVLFEMAYQLGVDGLLKFHRMWEALEMRNYAVASVEMMDSRWAIQTPSRAYALCSAMA